MTPNDLARELTRTISQHGKDSPEAKVAAIRMCHWAGVDPHLQYPVRQPPLSYVPAESIEPAKPAYYEEWERVIAEATRS